MTKERDKKLFKHINYYIHILTYTHVLPFLLEHCGPKQKNGAKLLLCAQKQKFRQQENESGGNLGSQ